MIENIKIKRAPIKRMFLMAITDEKKALTTCFNLG
jgi:hypothetical protein